VTWHVTVRQPLQRHFLELRFRYTEIPCPTRPPLEWRNPRRWPFSSKENSSQWGGTNPREVVAISPFGRRNCRSFWTARWVTGRPKAERGHGAERSPTAALDTPEQCVGDHGIGRTLGPAYMRSSPPRALNPRLGSITMAGSNFVGALRSTDRPTTPSSAIALGRAACPILPGSSGLAVR
jgi:hypothetical protein